MTSEELSAIEARANAATPGPWQRERPEQSCADIVGDYIVAANGDRVGEGTSASDTDFIAAARSGVPELLAEVRRLQSENGRLKLLASGELLAAAERESLRSILNRIERALSGDPEVES